MRMPKGVRASSIAAMTHAIAGIVPLAGALHPDRIEWRPNFEVLDFNPRHLRSGWQKVLAVICRQRLPPLIIQHLLKQRVADAARLQARHDRRHLRGYWYRLD
jgi:hypothetical protein